MKKKKKNPIECIMLFFMKLNISKQQFGFIIQRINRKKKKNRKYIGERLFEPCEG